MAEALSQTELKSRGIKIALDDFRAGYSSLKYLSRMPLDIVKIDRTFLEGIEVQNSSVAVFRAMCDLCRNHWLVSVIGDVETGFQHQIVKRAGVDLIRGFRHCGPISGDAITANLLGKRNEDMNGFDALQPIAIARN